MPREGDWWTAQDCADYLGIKPRTWHAYVRRPGVQNPVPQPVAKFGATPIWKSDDVREYAANRQRKTKTQHHPQPLPHTIPIRKRA
ncbi:hypothetical protein GS982_20430 [Rhodococcus hoagii]|nr:hypothetical protein [Prescottella equi]NKZ84562.1 hypothetical protein [Prescottella equi]